MRYLLKVERVTERSYDLKSPPKRQVLDQRMFGSLEEIVDHIEGKYPPLTKIGTRRTVFWVVDTDDPDRYCYFVDPAEARPLLLDWAAHEEPAPAVYDSVGSTDLPDQHADGFRFGSISVGVGQDFGEFVVRARVTNELRTVESVSFVATFLAGGAIAGTAEASRFTEWREGKTVTLTFASNDRYKAFDSLEFQVDDIG